MRGDGRPVVGPGPWILVPLIGWVMFAPAGVGYALADRRKRRQSMLACGLTAAVLPPVVLVLALFSLAPTAEFIWINVLFLAGVAALLSSIPRFHDSMRERPEHP